MMRPTAPDSMRDDVSETRECRDCGEMFTIGPGEREFYESRGLTLPKRCRECRQYRRQERE